MVSLNARATLGRIALGCVLVLSACASPDDAATTAGPSGGQVPRNPSSDGATDGGSEASFPNLGDSAGISVDGGGPSDPSASRLVAEVFGHSSQSLYRLDPETKAVTVVGDFSGCDAVIDIALDENSKLYATSYNALYVVDKTSAVCTLIASGTYPNSLSFVPKGTVDANAEALVGYSGSDYVRIDVTSGSVSTIGRLSSVLVSSGDIVSVKQGSTFLTVKGATCRDCLVEVDPKTGAMIKDWGSVGYGNVFGLAFWGGSVYGFSDDGELFEIKFDGAKMETVKIPIPQGENGLSFWGAGSTTSAPLTVVR